MRILLDAGADANIANEQGKTVLDMMANHDSSACKEVEKILKVMLFIPIFDRTACFSINQAHIKNLIYIKTGRQREPWIGSHYLRQMRPRLTCEDRSQQD